MAAPRSVRNRFRNSSGAKSRASFQGPSRSVANGFSSSVVGILCWPNLLHRLADDAQLGGEVIIQLAQLVLVLDEEDPAAGGGRFHQGDRLAAGEVEGLLLPGRLAEVACRGVGLPQAGGL